MATSRQEKTYNEIIEYYDLADQLVQRIEESVLDEDLAHKQFDVVEKTMVETLENCADELTTTYIEYVKSDNPKIALEVVQNSFGRIIAKIEECRNQILMLHDKTQKDSGRQSR